MFYRIKRISSDQRTGAKDMRRKITQRLAGILTMLFVAVVAANMVVSKDEPPAASNSEQRPHEGARDQQPREGKTGQRLREGTRLVDVPGRFEAVGDRVNFTFADSRDSIRVLENLSLQRVFRVLGQTQGGTQWTVSGTITEYNNGNYLLLTKAVQAGKPGTKESAPGSGIGTRPKVDYSNSPDRKSGEKKQEATHDGHP
jgi:hypothetical protein